MLAHWRSDEATEVARHASLSMGIDVGPGEVLDFAAFLARQGLTTETRPKRVARNWPLRNTLTWLMHNYLFFRIHLWRPDGFLSATSGYVNFLFSRISLVVLIAISVFGIVTTGQQWDQFITIVKHLGDASGLTQVGIAILLAKITHEFGHAYAARRFGCAVPSMGVAFIVMLPVLYTDTTHAWRLRSRHQRMTIAGAGIVAETTLAAAMLVAWPHIPAGPLQTGAVALASVSWANTLLFNLNPLMRFDGYYLLSEFLKVENLQDRAFALTRWSLREAIFGIGFPSPEPLPPHLRHALFVYALGTWIYRPVLFFAIALVVYHTAGPGVGIALMVVELGWFIVKPVMSEIGAWWGFRRHIRPRTRTLISALAFSALVGMAFVPFSGTSRVPAILVAGAHVVVFSPEPAYLKKLHVVQGQYVALGDPIADLDSPDIAYDEVQAEERHKIAQLELDTLPMKPGLVKQRLVIAEQVASTVTERDGLRKSRDRLRLLAPVTGRVIEVPDGVAPGRWLGKKNPVAEIAGEGPYLIEAYASEEVASRLKLGHSAEFVPTSLDEPRMSAMLLKIAPMAITTLARPALASMYGGPIETTPDSHSLPVPTIPTYRLLFQADGALSLSTIIGTMRLNIDKESLAVRAWRRGVQFVTKDDLIGFLIE